MAKKTDSPTASEPSLVTVRVTGQAIAENDAHFTKGATFETTPERAAALGSLVETLETVETPTA